MNKSTKKLTDGNLINKLSTYQAAILQSTMHRNLQNISDSALLPYGITKAQWMIIGTVYDHKEAGIRITDLAKIIGTNLPYITNTVNLLDTKSILTRVVSTLDNRSSLIVVHDKFKPNCKNIEKTLRGALRQKIYTEVTPEEFRIYMQVMYKLSKVKVN